MRASSSYWPGQVQGEIPPVHLERQAVIFYQADRAAAETAFTMSDWYIAIARYYTTEIPDGCRSLPIEPIPAKGTMEEQGPLYKRLETRMLKYRQGDSSLPVCLEEACVFTLPEPYGWRARRELAMRLGFLGVEVPKGESDVTTGLDGMARLSQEFTSTLDALVPMLANGTLDSGDAHHLSTFTQAIDGLTARAQGLKALAIRKVLGADCG